jgi:hypothetical protein
VGFRTPEQTFRTFQTALRGDLPTLEYRCLSAGFKQREGITGLTWREAREELLRAQPWIKHFARARVLSLEPRGESRAYMVAEVRVWFTERRLGLGFVREESYEIADALGPLEGDRVAFAEALHQRGDALVLELPFPAGTSVDEIADVLVARRWKIDTFESLGDPSEEP